MGRYLDIAHATEPYEKRINVKPDVMDKEDDEKNEINGKGPARNHKPESGTYRAEGHGHSCWAVFRPWFRSMVAHTG